MGLTEAEKLLRSLPDDGFDYCLIPMSPGEARIERINSRGEVVGYVANGAENKAKKS